jgi:hypothetical protein
MKKLIVLVVACTGLGFLIGSMVEANLKNSWLLSPGFFDAKGCALIGFAAGCLICVLYWVFKGGKENRNNEQ